MDKMWIMASDFFPHTNPSQKFVNWSDTLNDWVLDEERWFNYCVDMANRGVNMFRWLGWNCWFDWYAEFKDYKHNLTPWIQVSPGVYDLSQKNKRYWEIVKRMIEIANYPSQTAGINAPGIAIKIDLAYQYDKDKDDIKKNPFRNNNNGVHSLLEDVAFPFFEAYCLEWFKLKNEGLNIKFGMGNEMGDNSLYFGFKLLQLMDREKIWIFSWPICARIPLDDNDIFKEFPKFVTKNNLFMWYPLRQYREWDAGVKRVVHHMGYPFNGIDVLEHVGENWFTHPIGIELSDDGCMGQAGKPKAAQWYALVKRIVTWRGTDAVNWPWIEIDHPYIAIEHLPDDAPWDICKEEQLAVFDAIAKAYHEHLPTLENFGKWTKYYVRPECLIGEVKTEKCWDGSIITTHICENGKWKPTGAICPVKPQPIKKKTLWQRIIDVKRWTWQGWLAFGILLLILFWVAC